MSTVQYPIGMRTALSPADFMSSKSSRVMKELLAVSVMGLLWMDWFVGISQPTSNVLRAVLDTSLSPVCCIGSIRLLLRWIETMREISYAGQLRHEEE